MHNRDVREHGYVTYGHTGLYVNSPCAATTRLPVARALPQPCHAPSCHSTSRRSVALARRAPGHYVSRHDYSSSRLHQLYCAYAVHPDAPSCRSTSCRSVALALAVRPVTASRGATTHRPDCTSSTAPMSCIRTRRLDTRLLVGRSHWLSPCVRSLSLAM
jgi:hypothetical protein